MSTPSSSSPLLVVGAGPVGLVMASELRRYGLQVRIIDKAPTASTTSKALALWPRSLEMLEDMGTVAPFWAEGVPIRGTHFYANGDEIAAIDFSHLKSPFPNPVIVPQSRTEELLAKHLETFGTTVERQTELLNFVERPDGVHVSLKRIDGTREDIVTPWLLGCDGAHSIVRKSLGFTFSGSALEEGFWLVDANVSTEMEHEAMHIFLHDEGALVWFPMPEGRYRAVVNVPPKDAADSGTPPTLEQIQEVIARRMPMPAILSEATWIAAFRVNHRQASSYRLGRCFVAGDAAHIHSPAGGQGMNTGMQDAYNLAWKIALVHAGEAKTELLDSYEAERAPVARSVIDMAHRMTDMIMLRGWLPQQIRNHFLHWATGVNMVKEKMTGTLSEIEFGYPKSPAVEEHWTGGGALSLLPLGGSGAGVSVGDRVPPADFTGLDGATVRLYDLLKTPAHVVLFFAGEAVGRPAQLDLYDDLCSTIGARYPGLFTAYLVLPGEGISTRHGEDVLLDPESAVHQIFGAGAEAALYLLRPDSYIAYREKPPQRGRLLEYLEKIFIAQGV